MRWPQHQMFEIQFWKFKHVIAKQRLKLRLWKPQCCSNFRRDKSLPNLTFLPVWEQQSNCNFRLFEISVTPGVSPVRGNAAFIISSVWTSFFTLLKKEVLAAWIEGRCLRRLAARVDNVLLGWSSSRGCFWLKLENHRRHSRSFLSGPMCCYMTASSFLGSVFTIELKERFGAWYFIWVSQCIALIPSRFSANIWNKCTKEKSWV